jgi:hypothetical protein
MRLWAQTGVDGVSFMDDWGSQTALLISPEMWRRLFKPLYLEGDPRPVAQRETAAGLPVSLDPVRAALPRPAVVAAQL